MAVLRAARTSLAEGTSQWSRRPAILVSRNCATPRHSSAPRTTCRCSIASWRRASRGCTVSPALGNPRRANEFSQPRPITGRGFSVGIRGACSGWSGWIGGWPITYQGRNNAPAKSSWRLDASRLLGPGATRLIYWCRGRDLRPHDPRGPPRFERGASTSFATSAFTRRVTAITAGTSRDGSLSILGR